VLPDYPELKAELQKLIVARLKLLERQKAAPLSELRPMMMHEGKAMSFTRADGSKDKIVPKLMEATLNEKLQEAADQLATQKVQLFTKVFEEATDAIGNVVKTDGKPFDSTHLYQMIEKVQIDFDSTGRPIMPSFVVGRGEQIDQVRAVMTQIDADDVLRAKFEKLLVKKREEWRAREADRKLVG
jgi:hypothetical protein